MMKRAFSILGDFCEVTDCEHKTAPTIDQGYPLIRTPNIGRGTLILENVYRVSNQTYAAWTRRRRPEPGDLIMAREAPVGNVAIIPAGLSVALGQRTVLLRVTRTKELDPAYLNYLLNSDGVHTYLNALSNGATVGHLNVGDIRKLRLPEFPPIQLQRKIASILSAYDDLIENNKRRIAILEKMAEEIYREWFVRMRFSGHEDQKISGGLPSGWRLVPFSKAVKINPRETPGISDDFPFIGMEDLSTTSMYFTYKERRTSKAGSKFRNGDVLFPRITPSLENGKRGYVSCLPNGAVGIGSTEFIVFREHLIPKEYIYMISCSTDFRKHAEQSMVGASGRQRVQEKCFDSFLIRVPTKEVNSQFASITAPMFEMVSTLSGLNVLLANQRDLLLPRLISGKLSVDKLELPSNEKLASVSSAPPQQELAHA
jgi:type I restriction enzyme, S subunit